MYIRGFTKFGIKVLWRLEFLEYLRTLSLKFKVLKYPRNGSLHNTLIPNLVKPLMYIVHMYFECTLTIIEICPRGDHVYICSICFNKGTPSPPWWMIDPLRISCINQAVYSKTIYSCCGIVPGPDLILQCQIFISYRYIGLFYICCVFHVKVADESFRLVLRHNKGIA